MIGRIRVNVEVEWNVKYYMDAHQNFLNFCNLTQCYTNIFSDVMRINLVLRPHFEQFFTFICSRSYALASLLRRRGDWRLSYPFYYMLFEALE